MTKRADIHRPSKITPSDYHLEVSYSLATTMDNWPVPPINMGHVVEIQYASVEAGERMYGNPGKCGVCGAHFIYGDLWRHEPTNELVHLGYICADKYNLAADRSDWERENSEARRKCAAEQLREMKREQREAVLAEHPGLVEALQTDHYIVEDIAGRFDRTGRLSSKQIELVMKLAHEAANPAPDLPTAPVIEGAEVEIVGEVLSTKVVEGHYGGSLKMLVRDDRGFKVWGTVPKAAKYEDPNGFMVIGDKCYRPADRGDRITFTAKVEVSRDDECFGFFKRPKKVKAL